MILPHEEKFVLVKCNNKPVCTNKGYCLKLFLLPLTSVPVSDYYVYDLIETSLYITKDDSFKSLVESQPMIQKVKNHCIGCAMDLARDEILQDGVFSQYRNIHKLAEIYGKSNNEKNIDFFSDLHLMLEKNLDEHFKKLILSNKLSKDETSELNDCVARTIGMEFESRMDYLEKLSRDMNCRISHAENQISGNFAEVEL